MSVKDKDQPDIKAYLSTQFLNSGSGTLPNVKPALKLILPNVSVDEKGNMDALLQFITPLDPALGYPYMRVALSDTTASILGGNDSATQALATAIAAYFGSKNYLATDTVWTRATTATQSASLIDGATGATLLAAGAGKYRVFQLLVSNGTAGKIAVGELNVAALVPVNTPCIMNFGPTGILQNTAATAITITGAGGPATLNCTIIADAGGN